MKQNAEEQLLTPAQVARRFEVDPKTVTRWAKKGLLQTVRTLGGHRRYRKSDVDALTVPGYENKPASSGD